MEEEEHQHRVEHKELTDEELIDPFIMLMIEEKVSMARESLESKLNTRYTGIKKKYFLDNLNCKSNCKTLISQPKKGKSEQFCEKENIFINKL